MHGVILINAEKQQIEQRYVEDIPQFLTEVMGEGWWVSVWSESYFPESSNCFVIGLGVNTRFEFYFLNPENQGYTHWVGNAVIIGMNKGQMISSTLTEEDIKASVLWDR
jgi:hypothetical protein